MSNSSIRTILQPYSERIQRLDALVFGGEQGAESTFTDQDVFVSTLVQAKQELREAITAMSQPNRGIFHMLGTKSHDEALRGEVGVMSDLQELYRVAVEPVLDFIAKLLQNQSDTSTKPSPLLFSGFFAHAFEHLTGEDDLNKVRDSIKTALQLMAREATKSLPGFLNGRVAWDLFEIPLAKR